MGGPGGQKTEELARFLSLGGAERAALAAHLPELEGALAPALDRLYGDMRGSRAVIGHFADEQHIGRARRAQLEHWRSLFSGVFDERYEARAKRIGAAHAKIGLDHRFYVGGYALVLEELYRRLAAQWDAAELEPGSAGTLFGAVLKCAMLDMGVVLSAYFEALEAASTAKSRFLASMSHELRTPLNAVIGYSELALEELPPDADVADDVDNALSAARRLSELINGLLDLAKIEAGTVQQSLEPLDPVAIARVAVNLAGPELRRNRNVVELSFGEGIGLVTTDADKLGRCLHILLANAARFTRDGAVSVRVARETRREGDAVTFEIRDTGVGISEERLARLFDPLRASPTLADERDGVGLGLAITRGLARLLGGGLSASSAVGEGSMFTLWVPGAPPAQTNEAAA
jgi:signal transduction histidine kinase